MSTSHNFKTCTVPLAGKKGDKGSFSPKTNDLHKMARSLGGLRRYCKLGENVTPEILKFVLEGYWRCVLRPVGDGVFLGVICRPLLYAFEVIELAGCKNIKSDLTKLSMKIYHDPA